MAAHQALEVLEHLQQISGQIRKLAERTLKVAADLPPADGEQVRKSVAKLITFSERLQEIATTAGPNLDGLRRDLDESPWNYFDTAVKTLERIGHKRGDETDEPLN
jgi:hypothetical protein